MLISIDDTSESAVYSYYYGDICGPGMAKTLNGHCTELENCNGTQCSELVANNQVFKDDRGRNVSILFKLIHGNVTDVNSANEILLFASIIFSQFEMEGSTQELDDCGIWNDEVPTEVSTCITRSVTERIDSLNHSLFYTLAGI